jgi:hypothetical protein
MVTIRSDWIRNLAMVSRRDASATVTTREALRISLA